MPTRARSTRLASGPTTARWAVRLLPATTTAANTSAPRFSTRCSTSASRSLPNQTRIGPGSRSGPLLPRSRRRRGAQRLGHAQHRVHDLERASSRSHAQGRWRDSRLRQLDPRLGPHPADEPKPQTSIGETADHGRTGARRPLYVPTAPSRVRSCFAYANGRASKPQRAPLVAARTAVARRSFARSHWSASRRRRGRAPRRQQDRSAHQTNVFSDRAAAHSPTGPHNQSRRGGR